LTRLTAIKERPKTKNVNGLVLAVAKMEFAVVMMGGFLTRSMAALLSAMTVFSRKNTQMESALPGNPAVAEKEAAEKVAVEKAAAKVKMAVAAVPKKSLSAILMKFR
jgi:hypothetical protein